MAASFLEMPTMLSSIYFCLLWCYAFLVTKLLVGNSFTPCNHQRKKLAGKSSPLRQAKPPWVKKEIIRLKAFMPELGCRKITDSFNAHYEFHKRTPMTVGKTFVGLVIKQHLYDILQLRKKFKHRIPNPLKPNIIWATDLTIVTDKNKQMNKVLGILDHGSRACVLLKQLPHKTSITLLRSLLDCVELYGKPKYLRTDNEAIFTSTLFRFRLWVLNIKHQRIPVHSPWCNGRIERFFWTFKDRIKKLVIENSSHLDQALPEFRFWYNHVRTHQHLKGNTPAQVWRSQITNKAPTLPYYFSAWDNLLTGFYFPPPT